MKTLTNGTAHTPGVILLDWSRGSVSLKRRQLNQRGIFSPAKFLALPSVRLRDDEDLFHYATFVNTRSALWEGIAFAGMAALAGGALAIAFLAI